MPSARAGLLALAIGWTGAGCGDEPFTPSVRYRALGYPAATAAGCPASATELPPAIAAATRARLTYVDATTGALRCDVVLPLDGPAPVIAVPERIRPVDLTIEYLDDAGAVVGRGAAYAVDLAARAVVDVRIAPTDAFACGLDRAGAERAFHSATRLPGGEVLLLGGVTGPGGTGAAIDPGGGLFLQPTAELWLPGTGEIRTASIPGLIPRALHEAWVVGVDAGGVVTIAVQGGISVTGDAGTTAALVVGTSYRLEPSPQAIGASGELITYDPRTQTFTRTAMSDGHVVPRGFGALTGAGPALAAVGGEDLTLAADVRVSADHVAPDSGQRTASIGVRRPRIGATVTALAADRLLVWGGDISTGDGTDTDEVGELLVSWATAPASAPLSIDPGGEAGTARAFHTAALAGDGAVILGGGFRMQLAQALTPAAEVVQRVLPGGTTQTIATLADATTALAFGYGASVTLPDGDVLLAGGNPDATIAGCATDAQELVCATDQALRYETANGTLRAVGALGVARYGHRITVLVDGMALVSGGLAVGAAAATLRALPDVELFKERGAADDPLLPAIVRAAGDVARTADGEPLAPCTLIDVDDADGADAAP